MVYLGIDVVIMAMIGMVCIVLAIALCEKLAFTQREGELVVLAVAYASLAMTLGYVAMTLVMNAMAV